MRALMISQNMPSVSTTNGKVMTFRKNPRVALTRPITTAAISAEKIPDTTNPGTMRDTMITANALNIQLRRSLMAKASGKIMGFSFGTGNAGRRLFPAGGGLGLNLFKYSFGPVQGFFHIGADVF